MYESQVGYQLKKAQHLLHLLCEKRLKTLGITLSQFAVLTAIKHNHGITNAQLARDSFVSPQTMYLIVMGLVNKGYLQRKNINDDKKSLSIKITDKGIDIVEKADRLIYPIEKEMAEIIGNEKMNTLYSLLSEYGNNILAISNKKI